MRVEHSMNILKTLSITTLILTAPALYAQTAANNKTPAYGDNPNIFTVLAHKTGEVVQNTAEKVGAATEKGIQKIKPKVDETWDTTKSYTAEQAEIAKYNTRKGIDTVTKKVHETKDNIIGSNSGNVPIEQGSLSQNSTPQTIQVPTTAAQSLASPTAQINQPSPAQNLAPVSSDEDAGIPR